MLPAILICAFMVKYAAIQAVTVTASLGTKKSCVVEARDDVKLLCTVSSGCCGSARVWEKVVGAVSLLNNGLSTTDPSKYVEDYDGGGTGGGSIEFNLIIKNVQKSDFGINYQCRYGVTSSNKLFLNNILCNCLECAGKDYGWSILGTVIGTVNILIIAKVKKVEPKTVLIVGVLTFIISAVVNIPIAVPIGYLVCHCVDWKAPWFIILGLVTSGITGVIALTCVLKPGCCKVLIALCAVGSCICCICYTFTGSSQGSNGSNEQPLKENKKKKPAAEKSSNEPPLEKKKKKKSAAETRSRSPTAAAKHIKTANNETEMIPTEKGFSGDLEKKRPLPPLTTQLSPTNRPLPLPSSTRPLPSSTRPLPQITTNKGDN